MPRYFKVPNHFAEHQNDVARMIARVSERILDRNFRKFCAAAKFCVRNRVRSRRNPRRRVVRSLLTTRRGPRQLLRASACCGTSNSVRVAAQIFEKFNFGRKSAANRTQSHVPQHADARDSCWGPLRVVSKLRTTWRHGFRRDLTRFRM